MNRKLLCLDDERDFLGLYELILSAPSPATPAGFEVHCVTTGEQAAEAVRLAREGGQPFVGGFFDLALKRGMGGPETLRCIKELDPELHCVVVSAQVDRVLNEIQDIFGDSASDRWEILSKPFTEMEIRQKAHHLTSQWERRQREKKKRRDLELGCERRVEAERLAVVGILAQGLGNQFGELLSAVMQAADTGLDARKPEMMTRALSEILGSGSRAAISVRNLKALVSMEATRDDVDLPSLIQSCLTVVEYDLKRSRARLEVSLPEGLPRLRLNRVEVELALLNVILNAIQSMEGKSGPLSIRADRQGAWCRLRVEDRGCGIPEKSLSQIFEPLFTTNPERGSGIGLSVARRVLENHGCRIEVESKVGEGSAFTFYFPLKQNETADSHQS